MSDPVEVRCDADRDDVDIIDAVAKAKRIPRNQLVVEILKQWASDKRHESILVMRLAKGHGRDGAL